jgi:hypothetical protein
MHEDAAINRVAYAAAGAPRRANSTVHAATVREALMDDLHIEYIPLPDATPESELQCLANVYAFLTECAQKRKAVDAGDDASAATGRGVDETHGQPDASD